MAKETEVCPRCGALIVLPEMHATFHDHQDTIFDLFEQMLTIVWEDAKLDKNKKIEPPALPEEIDY